MNGAYEPDRGDFVWMEFMPQAGHEQSGRRPALVISPKAYNNWRGLAVVCPISTRAAGYTYEVGIPSNSAVSGVVLSDQVKSMDWRARYARYIGKAPTDLMDEVLENVSTLLEIEPSDN